MLRSRRVYLGCGDYGRWHDPHASPSSQRGGDRDVDARLKLGEPSGQSSTEVRNLRCAHASNALVLDAHLLLLHTPDPGFERSAGGCLLCGDERNVAAKCLLLKGIAASGYLLVGLHL